MDALVRYWILIVTAVGLVATVAVGADQIESNKEVLQNHEERIDKLEQIGRDIHNLNQNQNKILDILLKEK